MMSVSVRVEFDAAHRVADRNGRADLHGHRFVVELVASGPIPDDGMVADFSDLNRLADEMIVGPWGHGLLVWFEDLELLSMVAGRGWRVAVIGHPTSSEGLASHVASMFEIPVARLGCRLESVTVRDTPETSATWSR
jgi:6-pyruvoyl-tetrahydropterin synthase